MDISFKNDSLNKLIAAVGESGRNLKGEFAAACNKTARGMQVPINREIRTELATNAAAVKKTIGVTRKASKQRLVSAVKVSKTARIPIKEFGARHTKKGVTYRISKSKGRSLAPEAFMGPKPGAMSAKLKGHAFKRKGKSRLPIVKLHGPSPYGVFVKRNMDDKMAAEAQRRLETEILRRVQYNVHLVEQAKTPSEAR